MEHLYFWMLKPYPINVQRSLADLTGMLPKGKKNYEEASVNVCFIY